MNTNQFALLINEADISAQHGDWNRSLELIEKALVIDANNLGAITGAGTCLLNLGRASEAIPYFQKSARLASDSPYAHNNLGVAYLITDNLDLAEASFREALWLDEDDAQSWKNLAQVYLQQQNKLMDGVQILASVIQNDPNDIDALFQLALCYEIGGDIESTRELINRILAIQPDHINANRVLKDIEQQKEEEPQLRIARPEHAQKLAALKSLLKDNGAKINLNKSQPFSTTPINPINNVFITSQKTIAFYAPNEFSGNERYPALASFYAGYGHNLEKLPVFSPDHLSKYDNFLFYNPNLSGNLVDAVNRCMQNKKPYFVDFDIDFHNLPLDHPAYTQFGSGNPNALKIIEIILADASSITAASNALAQHYMTFTKKVEVALPAWTDEDPWWNRPTPKRDTINVGWLGLKADIPDLLTIKPYLSKLFKDNEQTIWVAAGNEDAYDVFPELPEERRIFLPQPTKNSLAYLLSSIDILLVPLRDNPFNQKKSDTPLLYAGIRHIPWVATPILSFKEWGVGGVLTETSNQWFNEIKKLADSTDLRHELGAAGRKKAESREYKV